MMVRCYWCISTLIIIPTIRCCSLTDPLCGWSAVVLSDRRYLSFWNFDSTISIDVIRMKSYMDSLFDPTCVPVRVTINKLPRFVSVFQNCGGLRTSKPYISVVFFYPVLHRSPCFPDAYFAALTWNFIDDTVLTTPSSPDEDNQWSELDSNSGPSGFETNALTTRPRCLTLRKNIFFQCSYCEPTKKCEEGSVAQKTYEKSCEGQEWKVKQCVGKEYSYWNYTVVIMIPKLSFVFFKLR